MVFMGIDWGTKHMGIALTDYEGRMAFPLKIIPVTSPEEVFAILKDTILSEGVKTVVVGVPVGTERETQAREFITQLSKQLTVPVVEQDESRSTKYVQHLAHDKASRAIKGKVKQAFTTLKDAFSAALILQAFIDTKKRFT